MPVTMIYRLILPMSPHQISVGLKHDVSSRGCEHGISKIFDFENGSRAAGMPKKSMARPGARRAKPYA